MRKTGDDPSHSPVIAEETPCVPARGWAEKIRKVYEVDLLLYPSCGGRISTIAFIEDHIVIDNTIDHLKLTFVAERPSPQSAQQELLPAAEERGEYF